MATSLANFFSYSSSSSSLHSSAPRRTSLLSNSLFNQSGISARTSNSSIRCFSSNGRPRESETKESAFKEEKRRSDLAARIASGEFTVQKSGLVSMLRTGLSKIGPGGKFLAEVLVRLGGDDDDGEFMAIPQAKGSFKAVGEQAFFIPLYELHLIYGGIFRLTFGPKSFLIVSDPELAKHILKDNCKAYSKGILAEILDFVMGKGLIPADGEIWRVRRRAIVPALHKKFVAAMINLFGRASYRLCEKLDVASSDGEDVEMESLFSRLTLDIIGKAVFNYDFDSLSLDNGIVEAVYTVLREAEQRSTSPIPTWEIPIWKDLSPRQQKVTKALKLINDILDDLIAICKRMVDEEKLQFHEEYINEEDPSILHFLLASGDDVSSKQLRDDLMTMLIAGHETSAAVLTWTFYLLSKEPKVVAKLQEEVDSVLGDRFPTIEDMKKLKYTTRVINESIRLYPQPPVLIRRSIEADQLGKYPIKRKLGKLPEERLQANALNGNGCGCSVNSSRRKSIPPLSILYQMQPFVAAVAFTRNISRNLHFENNFNEVRDGCTERDSFRGFRALSGEDIFISVWNIHRSPLHWTDAESFNPERWPIDGPNPNEVNQNFSYLPFGGGPRKCVGDMFATFETVVATAMLARRFNFEMAPGAPPVEMTTGATIHTTEGLKMTVTHRFRPPVIPSLEKNVIKINGDQPLDSSLKRDQKGEVIST